MAAFSTSSQRNRIKRVLHAIYDLVEQMFDSLALALRSRSDELFPTCRIGNRERFFDGTIIADSRDLLRDSQTDLLVS